ncbi:RluA family pseudouridine synthase [Candidatus Dojkabacteria bacterium]|uniref:Pseudouridine synthase n=1 Tax=Candidatus Dojkabacteria bacterium TaxID=2099670 RepID=A0A955I6L0_9BACT|nr:RluA family pseudouridine synthase [Candidatus Dojkabacteria bacterium]
MNISKTLKVEESQEGKRLDLFLAFKFNDLTRSIVKKQIESGNVRVENVIEYRPNYKVRKNDEINCDFEIEEKGGNGIIPQDIPLKIIYEDENLVAIDKPVGMVVHPSTSNWDSTLLNALFFRYSDLSKVGDSKRSGLIHRLDKDTSGIVLVGKTNEGLWYYSKLFAERKIEKTYLAVVKGDFYEKFGPIEQIVDNYLGRNQINRKKFAKVSPSKGKKAITAITFLRTLEYQGQPYSLLKVQPKTGRTHQIRVHLSELGFPILGDVVYGKGNAYPRLMLHAWKLKLKMLTGEQKELEAKPDESFNNL